MDTAVASCLPIVRKQDAEMKQNNLHESGEDIVVIGSMKQNAWECRTSIHGNASQFLTAIRRSINYAC